MFKSKTKPSKSVKLQSDSKHDGGGGDERKGRSGGLSGGRGVHASLGSSLHYSSDRDSGTSSNRPGSADDREFFDLNPVQILGSFIPDFVLSKLSLTPPNMKTASMVVLVMDMSGFTALTEAYSMQGKGGTDKLSTTISRVMTPLAERILAAHGDIVEFAGDALIAYWVAESAARLPELIQTVIDCALICQEKHGVYETDVQILVRIKLGICAGDSHILTLGNAETCQFSIFGPSALGGTEAESMAASGDVIVHPHAWRFCSPTHFKYTQLSGGFVKVTAILKRIENDYLKRISQTYQSSARKSRIFETRPPLESVSPGRIDEDLFRRYILPAVLRKLDDQLPLDYVNETRIVTIVFIKLEIIASMLNDEEFIFDTLQAAFLKIIDHANHRHGCLTKVILFDKGWTFLLAFGLPGQVQENQGRSALKFARRVKEALLKDKGIPMVSIGITTGSVYCGIVGHPLRREYTMLGRAVNKAARIMCAYPGIVSCDSDTMYNSKLPQYAFQQLEQKMIKGFQNPGIMFEFMGHDAIATDNIKQYTFPILGRSAEMNEIQEAMLGCSRDIRGAVPSSTLHVRASGSGKIVRRNERRVRFGANGPEEEKRNLQSTTRTQMLILEGPSGIGKSRLLSAAIANAKKLNGWNVATYTALEIHSDNWMIPMRHLLAKALNMQAVRTVPDKEQYLTRIAKVNNDTELLSSICILNELFQINLPLTAKVMSLTLDAPAQHKYTHFVLAQLLRYTNPDQFIMFAVEDAQYLHESTWQYLLSLSSLPFVFVLMTLRRNPDGTPKISDTAMRVCYHVTGVAVLKLEGLGEEFILPLACQFLEVKAIPHGVEKLLKDKCEGNAELVEILLQELRRTEKIEIVSTDDPTVRVLRATLKYCDISCLLRIDEPDWNSEAFPSGGSMNQSGVNKGKLYTTSSIVATSSMISTSIHDPLERVCVLKVKTVKHITLGILHKEALLHELDTLNTSEQMMLKCASILGRTFSRKMLDYILPSYRGSNFRYLQSFCSLIEKEILICSFVAKERDQGEGEKSKKVQNLIRCACARQIGVRLGSTPAADDDDDMGMSSGSALPNYAHCAYPAFSNPYMIEAAFELLTTNQLAELSLKAIEYLEDSLPFCKVCGGEDTRSKFGFDLANLSFTYTDSEGSILAEQKTLLHGLDGVESLSLKTDLSLKQKLLLLFSRNLQDLDSYKCTNNDPERVRIAMDEKIQQMYTDSNMGFDREYSLLVLDVCRALRDVQKKFSRNDVGACRFCESHLADGSSEILAKARRTVYDGDPQLQPSHVPSHVTTSSSNETPKNALTTTSEKEDVGSKPEATEVSDVAKKNAGSRNTIKRSAVVFDINESLSGAILNSSGTERKSRVTGKRSAITNDMDVETHVRTSSVRWPRDSELSHQNVSSRETLASSSQPGFNSLRKSTNRKSTLAALVVAMDVHTMARISTASKPRQSVMMHHPSCKCDMVDAKIQFELSKHYRNASLPDQSLGCLLCAIEFIINSGDTEDAFFLLIDLPDLVEMEKGSTVEVSEARTKSFYITKATFLKGVANFQTGDHQQAKKYFLSILEAMDVSIDSEKYPSPCNFMTAKFRTWLHHNVMMPKWLKNNVAGVLLPKTLSISTDEDRNYMKSLRAAVIIITMAYLQEIYKFEGNPDRCAALCAQQALQAEEMDDNASVLISSYCNAVEGFSGVGEFQQATMFERKALAAFERFFAYSTEVMSTDEASLSAYLFLSVATVRLLRGETRASAEAAYAALRIANLLHDATLICNIFPILVHALLFLLKIHEIVEALQQLWYYAEEEEDDIAKALYFCTNLDLILDCSCTVEPFYYCERFVAGKKWKRRLTTYRELEIQYNLETSIALWFARYSKWGNARVWMESAWRHVPKTKSFHSLSGDLKLFQCYLLLRYYRFSKKSMENFQAEWDKARQLRSSLIKSIVTVPVLQARFHHLQSYYYKLLKRERKSRQQLSKALKYAQKHENHLETHFIEHTKLVWEERCLPSVEYYWVDHADEDLVDWHVVERMPWANVMYTLPIREEDEDLGEEADV